jgi:hypothetical protein
VHRRDSLFGDLVLWSGRPKVVTTPAVYRVSALVAAIASAISTASAVVVSTAIGAPPGQRLAFAAWMATLAVALATVPRWWQGALEYVLTDRHVVVRRGRVRRTIDRRAISFARIHWDPKHPGIGDLELVRAVPTGALRRSLSIVLTGLVAPDRVWAIIRGVTPAAPAGDGQRLLAQRLDEGERVLWSAHPTSRWRRWLPSGLRPIGTVAIGVVLGAVALTTALHANHGLRLVLRSGLAARSLPFVALVACVTLTVLLLAVAALSLVYSSIVRPARLDARTRYWVTDRRVLIQRGDDELHLDRSRIADVIEAPIEGGLSDVYLVLDGPLARAFAPSGAFGEKGAHGLLPVLHGVGDAAEVARILRSADAPAPDDARAAA